MKRHMDTYCANLKSGKLPGHFSYGLGTRLFQHLVSTTSKWNRDGQYINIIVYRDIESPR